MPSEGSVTQATLLLKMTPSLRRRQAVDQLTQIIDNLPQIDKENIWLVHVLDNENFENFKSEIDQATISQFKIRPEVSSIDVIPKTKTKGKNIQSAIASLRKSPTGNKGTKRKKECDCFNGGSIEMMSRVKA
jgi:hypothetical protein